MAEYIVGIADDRAQDIDRLYREYAVNGTIVRCRDCKHGCRMGYSEVYICESPKQNKKNCVHIHKPDWYCADGERKGGAELGCE